MFDALADLAAFRFLGLDPASRLGEAVHFFVMDATKIFILLIVVIYVMGLLRAMLSPERVRAFVRDRPDWQAGDAVQRFHDYRYLRDNPAGEHRELWFHEQGDRSWLVVTRNTLTHEITKVELARDVAIARGRGR